MTVLKSALPITRCVLQTYVPGARQEPHSYESWQTKKTYGKHFFLWLHICWNCVGLSWNWMELVWLRSWNTPTCSHLWQESWIAYTAAWALIVEHSGFFNFTASLMESFPIRLHVNEFKTSNVNVFTRRRWLFLWLFFLALNKHCVDPFFVL